MSKEATFLDLCLTGKAKPVEIDDFIDRWHEVPKGQELHEYLGLTETEYALWLRQPDALGEIIRARGGRKPHVGVRRTAG